MTITVTIEPAEEPITLAEAKAHLRVGQGSPEDTTDDLYISSLIKAVRKKAEKYLNRSICTQTIEYTADSFPSEFSLPRPPIQSVTSIIYTDADGNPQTLAAGQYQTAVRGDMAGKIKESVSGSWPAVEGSYDSVIVKYVAGYGIPSDSPDLVPTDIKQALLLMVGTLYEYREELVAGVSVSEIPQNAEWLLNPYRINRL